jgi:hypothetical protein
LFSSSTNAKVSGRAIDIPININENTIDFNDINLFNVLLILFYEFNGGLLLEDVSDEFAEDELLISNEFLFSEYFEFGYYYHFHHHHHQYLFF